MESKCVSLTKGLRLLTSCHVIGDLSNQSRVPGVTDVILSDVTVEPVAEVKEAVIQGDQDVSDQGYIHMDRCWTRGTKRQTDSFGGR